MRSIRNSLLCVAAFASLLGARAADVAPISPRERKTAEDLYNVKCAKCHKFYDPADYSQKEWDIWMHKMARKSKLKPAQEELLARYLDEFRAKHK